MESDQRDTSTASKSTRIGFIRHASDESQEFVSTAATRTVAERYVEFNVVWSERSWKLDQSGNVIDDRLQTVDSTKPRAADWPRAATIAAPFDKELQHWDVGSEIAGTAESGVRNRAREQSLEMRLQIKLDR